MANALLRGLARSAEDTETVLDALREICRLVVPEPAELRRACQLAEQRGLTFYDAAYAAVAETRAAVLVSSDRELLRVGAAEAPAALATRLGLLDPT